MVDGRPAAGGPARAGGADRQHRDRNQTAETDADRLDAGEHGLDEATVVARAQDGDVDAFETLVDSYQGRIFRLATRMLNDRDTAEEVVQETMITAWRRLPTIGTAEAFGGWLYRVATNRCLDLLRQRATRKTDTVDAEFFTDVHDQHSDRDPERGAEAQARGRDLQRALDQLSDDQRACWLLREVHGRPYSEIASTLGITETVVRGRLARARRNLAEAMSSWR